MTNENLEINREHQYPPKQNYPIRSHEMIRSQDISIKEDIDKADVSL